MSTPTRHGESPYAHVWKRIATGNAAWTLLGLQLRELQPDRAVLDLRFRPEVLNPSGTVHGGIVASLADAAGACAVYTRLAPEKRLSSIEFKINFLKPVRGDAWAEGRALHVGSRTGVSYVEVWCLSDVVAAGLLTFAVLD